MIRCFIDLCSTFLNSVEEAYQLAVVNATNNFKKFLAERAHSASVRRISPRWYRVHWESADPQTRRIAQRGLAAPGMPFARR